MGYGKPNHQPNKWSSPAALEKGKSYNSLFHMSKRHMYRQLTSQFDKFSNDAAQYAIDHLKLIISIIPLFNAKNYEENSLTHLNLVFSINLIYYI